MMINQIQVLREDLGTVEQSRSHFNTVGVLRIEVGPLELHMTTESDISAVVEDAY